MSILGESISWTSFDELPVGSENHAALVIGYTEGLQVWDLEG